MGRAIDTRDLAIAAWKTWGAQGLVRRAAYEGRKRTIGLQRTEQRWLSLLAGAPPPLTRLPIEPGAEVSPPPPGGLTVEVYGGPRLDTTIPPDWHRQPVTGRRYPRGHWSTISDADATLGDIKDVWELSRLGWLHPALRRWCATGDESCAELIWQVVEDFVTANPPYRGPHWMCGQETSLRAISTMFLTFAIDPSEHTTPERRSTVDELVATSVGRVHPTLRYAMSQRNNHAISEAGFLWTATVLAPQIPRADKIRSDAARALTEAVTDQFRPDGSYIQQSPTYQRLALQVLLWCLFVSRSTSEHPPEGVPEAVSDSVGFLRALIAPASDGRVPNLGGNDGAQLFPLTPVDIGDLRPVVAHAAAATGQPSGFGPGPWDEEPAWFGLEPVPGTTPHQMAPTVSTHPLTRGTTHAVVRAGPIPKRPAHADQLHTDIWLDGTPVAVDPGSYRYTAPPPWDNALASEQVHNLPTRSSAPQATRRGRFFWQRWSEARVLLRISDGDLAAIVARLDLADRTQLHRLVAVRAGTVVVVDQSSRPTTVRWNLPDPTRVSLGDDRSEAEVPGWSASFAHGLGAETLIPTEDDPASGWHAPTYAVRLPLTPVLLPSDGSGRVCSSFVTDATGAPLALPRLDDLDPAAPSAAAIRQVMRAR
ncbi:MAG: heparinase II/III family protein [Acidimicrobiales bacterium]|nr:heparinase II/III family protein [Acidimicrobiales bacterium]